MIFYKLLTQALVDLSSFGICANIKYEGSKLNHAVRRATWRNELKWLPFTKYRLCSLIHVHILGAYMCICACACVCVCVCFLKPPEVYLWSISFVSISLYDIYLFYVQNFKHTHQTTGIMYQSTAYYNLFHQRCITNYVTCEHLFWHYFHYCPQKTTNKCTA